MFTELIIVGSGGHAAVVASAAIASGIGKIRVADEDDDRVGFDLLGVAIERYDACREDLNFTGSWHIAIGDAAARERIGKSILESGQTLASVIHPAAEIASSASIAGGCFLAAASIVAPRAVVERNCIVNHGAIVDHDCRIGPESHVAPGAVLGGSVRVGRSCLVGANSVILSGVTVGNSCVIGAGSVVTRDIPDRVTVVGNPAKELHK